MNWDQIVHENAPGMFRLAKRILGSSSDAEEVVQDAFVNAFRLEQRQIVRNWGGLMRRLVTRASLDCLRRRRATARLDAARLASTTADPADLASAREIAERLRGEIARLPRQQATVFCLFCFDAMSHQAIAEALNICTGAVATALHKARKRLASALTRPMKTTGE
ncbi:MAG: RNA polymerase sigma factor [Thermoguttaceae bacterium]